MIEADKAIAAAKEADQQSSANRPADNH